MQQIAGLVSEHQANVVLLQEVCGVAADSHMALLKAALGTGWSFARADGARPDGRVDCRGSLSGNLGLGIAVKSRITDTEAGTSRRFTSCDADQSLMDRTANEPDSGPANGYSDHAPLIGYLPGA
ncbi:hypothetical protein [Nonomuraea sp. B5E05]|uniref:hypothetical protein n=1 Tax=Nonomuraea sp. B5E05 TaxID=3153569 RepID=UPI0032605B0B